MKATIRYYLELAAQWAIGWLMDKFLGDPIAHLEAVLFHLAEAKGGGADPSLTLPAFAEDGGGEGTVGGTRGVGRERGVGGVRDVTHQAAANAAGQRLALAIAFVLASIVFMAGFVVGRVL
ncbi:hypothetical protein GC175_04050 [bacterium]|nr:hypothetical protein [bacterium]